METAMGEPDAAPRPVAAGEAALGSSLRWGGRRSAPLLTTAAAVLGFLLVALGAAYLDVRGDLADRTRALDMRTAERDRLAADLADVGARRAELESTLREAQAKPFVTAGYDKVRDCVATYAAMERQLRERLAGTPGIDGTYVIGQGASATTTDGSQPFLLAKCDDAEPYLR